MFQKIFTLIKIPFVKTSLTNKYLVLCETIEDSYVINHEQTAILEKVAGSTVFLIDTHTQVMNMLDNNMTHDETNLLDIVTYILRMHSVLDHIKVIEDQANLYPTILNLERLKAVCIAKDAFNEFNPYLAKNYNKLKL